MNIALSQDRRRAFNNVVLGELTTITPPTIAERKVRWFAKAQNAGYDFITGNRQEHFAREYERQEMLDGREPELPF